MDTIPSWKTPHRFRRLLPPGRGDEVITYGLVSMLLVEVDLARPAGLAELAERVGIAPLAALVSREQPTHDPRPWSAIRASVEAPPSAVDRIRTAATLAEFGRPFELDADTVLEDFANEAENLRRFADQIRPLTAPIAEAANTKGRPSENVPTELFDLLEDYYGKGLALERLERTRRPTPHPLWGFRFRNLAERAIVELFELYTLRPVLDRCVLCKRPFVLVRSKRQCRLNLWRLPRREDRGKSDEWHEAVAFCVPDDVVDQLKASRQLAHLRTSDYRRKYKRLNQRARREEKARPNSRRARDAREALEQFKEANPQDRGPKPRPSRTAPELVPLR